MWPLDKPWEAAVYPGSAADFFSLAVSGWRLCPSQWEKLGQEGAFLRCETTVGVFLMIRDSE